MNAPRKRVEVAAAVITRPDGTFLLGLRAASTFYGGYWEFPGGKVEPGERPRDALIRELDEELGIHVTQAHPWIVREHDYEHAHVRLHFFKVTAWQGEPRSLIHAALAWQRCGAIDVAPMLPANAPVLRALGVPPLYAITHAWEVGMDAALDQLDRALEQGVRCIQIRESALAAADRVAFAREAIGRARRHGALVLINSDVDLARNLGADGVHLQSAQLMAHTLRPDFPWVAASCHNAEQLAHAARLGVDFVVLGPVMPTASHPGAPTLGWDGFSRLIEHSPLPVFALGGLGVADMARAQQAGAHGIAAIRGAWAT